MEASCQTKHKFAKNEIPVAKKAHSAHGVNNLFTAG
jgi:hypothetical protein